MRQFFKHRESAENSLKRRKDLAYIRYAKCDDKVLIDNSQIHVEFRVFSTEYGFIKRLVWYVDILIVTENMLKDLKDLGHIDIVSEIENKIHLKDNK